jgi:TonB family protein
VVKFKNQREGLFMKTFFSMLLGLLLLTGVSAEGISAQTAPKTINGGVVNSKASLPKPEYPDSLREAGVEGTVVVNIIIDETGAVIFAEAELNDQRVRKSEDGTVMEPMVVDPQLRASAETAARGAKFAPTLLSNVPVQVKGKIVYNFSASANKPVAEMPKVATGGVLNGKATSLPLPEYPAAARAVKAGGAVAVQIVIDEYGNVMSATAVSGHPLLRSASEAAARQAKFAPTILYGEAAKVAGVLIFNFAP